MLVFVPTEYTYVHLLTVAPANATQTVPDTHKLALDDVHVSPE